MVKTLYFTRYTSPKLSVTPYHDRLISNSGNRSFIENFHPTRILDVKVDPQLQDKSGVEQIAVGTVGSPHYDNFTLTTTQMTKND